MKRAHLPYLALWLVILSVFAAQGVTMAKSPATTGHFTFNSTTGSAFMVNDASAPPVSVTISIAGTYHQVGSGGKIVQLTVTSGSITVNGGAAQDLLKGNGVYNPATGKIVITALVDVPPGAHGRNLVLYGTVSSGYYYSQLGGTATFVMPQSKLSGAYFLAVEGTLSFSA
jgi:hypothetical protein